MRDAPGPPPKLDGADVLAWTRLSDRADSRVAGAAVCRYAGASECYLFYCDAAWNVIEDWDHVSPAEASASLDRRYSGAVQQLIWRVETG
jgi:hypothetical protein